MRCKLGCSVLPLAVSTCAHVKDNGKVGEAFSCDFSGYGILCLSWWTMEVLASYRGINEGICVERGFASRFFWSPETRTPSPETPRRQAQRKMVDPAGLEPTTRRL